jgi:putative hydrolase of the HAD superfamily
MPIRGVLFDMGGTLLHYSAPGANWEDTEKIGAEGVYALLQTAGYHLPPREQALEQAWDYARRLWASIVAQGQQVRNFWIDEQIEHLVALWGLPALPPPLVQRAAHAYMTAIQAHVWPLDGATETLAALRDQGLRIGLISNTHWPGHYHVADLERFALLPYLEHLIFSADVAAWKPGEQVFALGLEALQLAPQEAVYVGDTLYFDVWGAQQAGLRAVWIEQPHRWLPDGLDVTPDATIRALPDLVDVVRHWM